MKSPAAQQKEGQAEVPQDKKRYPGARRVVFW